MSCYKFKFHQNLEVLEEMMEELIHCFIEGYFLSVIEFHKVNQNSTECIEFGLVCGSDAFMEGWQFLNVFPVLLCDGIIDDMEDFGSMSTEVSVCRQVS